MTGFVIGFFVGGMLGTLGMALLVISKQSDERAEEMRRKEGIE